MMVVAAAVDLRKTSHLHHYAIRQEIEIYVERLDGRDWIVAIAAKFVDDVDVDCRRRRF